MVLVHYSKEGLTPEMEEIAQRELGETPLIRKDSLEKLKQFIANEPDFYPYMDDEFLLMFLRHKKHNVEKTFNTLLNYYHFKEKYSGIFMDILPSESKKVMDMNCYSVLPYRDPQHRTIVVCLPGRFNWQEASVNDLMAIALTIGVLGHKFDAISVCGWIMIFDAKDFSLSDLLKFVSVRFLLFAFNSLQDCLPFRIKEIHVVNEPVLYRTTYNAVKYALSKKIRERVFLHGSNLEELHKYVSPEYLSEELGGTLGPIDSKDLYKIALTHESVFEEMRNCGFKKRDIKMSES